MCDAMAWGRGAGASGLTNSAAAGAAGVTQWGGDGGRCVKSASATLQGFTESHELALVL